MTRPDPDQAMSDDELVQVLALVLDEDEPLPAGAAEFAAEAFVWRDMEGELAALLHDSALEEAVVLRDESGVRLLVFQAGDVSLDIEHGPDGLAGAVSPPARYSVEVHEAGSAGPNPAAPVVHTDECGMFDLRIPQRGSLRFVVREPRGRVAIISPWVTL